MTETKIARWEQVYTELKTQIQHLELVPGAHISEGGVAAQFGVSASPVRDALGRLSQEGLLTVKRGQGYTVSSLTIGGISEICDVRYVLELGVGKLAMERCTEAEIEPLRELSAATGVTDIPYDEMVTRNCEFHVALSTLARNTKLTESVRRVMDDSVRVFHLGLHTFATHGMQADHDGLLDAIAARDEVAMTEIVHREAYDASQRVLAELVRNPDPHAATLISA
jgi:DNA-binding GntR family transcriptional regulator